MKFYTSYFYQVRFMNPNIIPMSTAMWDPKWFHNFKDQKHWFIDRHGVVNGFRIEPFVPGPQCNNLCKGKELCQIGSPEDCAFLNVYYHQLISLNFGDIMERFYKFSSTYKRDFKIEGDISFALLVHEAPNNMCSERLPIQKWFHHYNIDCEEWNHLKKL